MKEIAVTFNPEESKDKYSQEEIDVYIQRGVEKYGAKLKGIELKEVEGDSDSVDIYYDVGVKPFLRLRRVTGYLVGDLTRFNNAKRAEEHDRVKHI